MSPLVYPRPFSATINAIINLKLVIAPQRVAAALAESELHPHEVPSLIVSNVVTTAGNHWSLQGHQCEPPSVLHMLTSLPLVLALLPEFAYQAQADALMSWKRKGILQLVCPSYSLLPVLHVATRDSVHRQQCTNTALGYELWMIAAVPLYFPAIIAWTIISLTTQTMQI